MAAIPLVILTSLVGAASIYSLNKIITTTHWVEHRQRVIADARAIVTSATDMQTGMRGYLLAGEDSFLEPYTESEGELFERTEALKNTVSDNPAQVARLEAIEALVREWQTKVTEPQIALRREIGNAETTNDMARIVAEERGKVFFDGFREHGIRCVAGRVEGNGQ